MRKVQAMVSRNASFVYHMLSVAKVGYDNEYGEQYRERYSEQDLQMLKKHELHITVAGGVHCGQLYWLLIMKAASLPDDISVPEYYEMLNRVLEIGDSGAAEKELSCWAGRLNDLWDTAELREHFEGFIQKYGGMAKEIQEITAAMSHNYLHFVKEIWPVEKELLDAAAASANQLLESCDLVRRWEAQTGYTYARSFFGAVLVRSIAKGAQAIDIAADRDVFLVPNDSEIFVHFISHEVGIYLLRDASRDIVDLRNRVFWKPFESLAGFFNERVMQGTIRSWQGDAQYLEFYRKLCAQNPDMPPHEMLQEALKEFGIT